MRKSCPLWGTALDLQVTLIHCCCVAPLRHGLEWVWQLGLITGLTALMGSSYDVLCLANVYFPGFNFIMSFAIAFLGID